MMVLIYGGSSSGKSAFAENYVCNTDYKNRFYLATMASYDDEAEMKIKRHQRLRKGKGFKTLESPIDIGKLATKENCFEDSIVLLECMSNLVANEMFRDGRIYSSDYVISKILEDIETLKNSVDCLTIVSNNIFEDGIEYDDAMKEYLRALGSINAALAKQSDEVYEVVVGIGVKK